MNALADNPFAIDDKDYTRDVNVKKWYIEMQAAGLAKLKGITFEKAKEFILSKIRPGGEFEFKDPKVNYLERQENGDREKKQTTLSKYIDDSLKAKELIAPTFTTYVSATVEKSLLALFIEDGVNRRDEAKGEAKRAEALGDRFKMLLMTSMQTMFKRKNNSVSGSHCTPSNPLYNRTSHSTLTSNCRVTAALGNANNEKMLCGNRHYWSSDIVINNIVSITKLTDLNKVKNVVNKYNLHIPTTDNVMDVIEYSTHHYWWSTKEMEFIRTLVDKLTDIEKCAFVYVSDLYHLRKYNDDFMRKFIGSLTTKKIDSMAEPIKYIKSSHEDYVNFAQLICYNETQDKGKEYAKKFTYEQTCTVASTVKNIRDCVTQYSDLIEAFLTTKNMPASMAYFPSCTRKSVITGDTDSTIFTVQDWVIWYKKKLSFDSEAIAVANAMIFFASATIGHILATMSKNVGVEQSKLHDIAMKNEFYYMIYMLTNLGKHYTAAMAAKEGSVYKKMKLDTKGVYLKNSTLPAKITDQANGMMWGIFYDVIDNGCIDLSKYIKEVVDTEKEIMRSIRNSESTYLRTAIIKDASTYTLSDEESPYKHHYFWNQVFGCKYGYMPDPPYDTLKFSVTTSSKKSIQKWIDSIEDEQIKNNLITWVKKYDSKNISTLMLPTTIIVNKGVPKEIIPILNERKVAADICKIYYIMLETLGIYVQDDKIDRLLSDDYFLENETFIDLGEILVDHIDIAYS